MRIDHPTRLVSRDLTQTLREGSSRSDPRPACYEQEPKSPFVFTSERGAPFTTAGFARMMERAGSEAAFRFKPHPHMLRHACGYALANKGHDTRALQAYLGHRNIQHTVRYSELAAWPVQEFLAITLVSQSKISPLQPADVHPRDHY
jgi:site-specific recombinase XerD